MRNIISTVLLTFIFGATAPGQTVINGGRVIKGVWDASGATLSKPVRTGTSLPSTCGVGEQFFLTVSSAGNNLYLCSSANNWSAAGATSANLRTRAIGYTFDGGGAPLSSGITKYLTVPFACTISGWDIAVDAGTATVSTWKIATGTAIPNATNSISFSGVSISSGTAVHSSTVTDFATTTVAAGDIFAFNLSAVSGATYVNFILECVQ